MAFSFNTFVEDQEQAAKDVIRAVTPTQVNQLAEAYKEGLNASPKEVINETIEQFTGVDLSQTAGIDGVGQKLTEFVKSQAADLTKQLEAQLLGCINMHIRDLMNKVPAIDFIINFEDRINNILGNFRNKLERKIDSELRKVAYQKLKIQQTTLFKQRISAKIKNICPGATPASTAEVEAFNSKVKDLLNKRKEGTVTAEDGLTLVPESITKTAEQVRAVPSKMRELSEKFKKEHRESDRKVKETAVTEAKKVQEDIEKEIEEQLNNTKADDIVIEDLITSNIA